MPRGISVSLRRRLEILFESEPPEENFVQKTKRYVSTCHGNRCKKSLHTFFFFLQWHRDCRLSRVISCYKIQNRLRNVSIHQDNID